MGLDNQEWFGALLDDCKAITTEYGFTSRWARIEGYFSLGKRILEENDNFKRSEVYGEGIVKKVSTSLGMSERTLQYAIQFAQKFPDLSMLPVGKDYTWSRVIKELLPENPLPPKEKKHTCPVCGAVY
jgi:hypothetical protein